MSTPKPPRAVDLAGHLFHHADELDELARALEAVQNAATYLRRVGEQIGPEVDVQRCVWLTSAELAISAVDEIRFYVVFEYFDNAERRGRPAGDDYPIPTAAVKEGLAGVRSFLRAEAARLRLARKRPDLADAFEQIAELEELPVAWPDILAEHLIETKMPVEFDAAPVASVPIEVSPKKGRQRRRTSLLTAVMETASGDGRSSTKAKVRVQA